MDDDMQVIQLGTDVQTRTAVSLTEEERKHHCVLIGHAQFGKTTILQEMALQDLKTGTNAIVFDPMGDLSESLMQQAAAIDPDKVQLFEITRQSVYTFNPLEVDDPDDPLEVSRTIDSLLQIFKKHWTGEFAWGPRVSRTLGACFRTIIYSGQDYTLYHIPELFTNERFLVQLTKHIQHPDTRRFWDEYQTIKSQQHRSADTYQLIESSITRLSQFLANEWLSRILYHPHSTIRFDELLNKQIGQLHLVPVPVGRLGSEPAALLGSLLLGKLVTMIFGRVDSGGQLPRLNIYIDELGRFSLPLLAPLWVQGSKWNISLTTTLQNLSQVGDEEMRSAVLSAGNHVCFQLIDSDARTMAGQMPIPDPIALTRPEPQLLFSQIAVEDIWKKGHPNPEVAAVRKGIFWIVDDLERLPQEDYWWYDWHGEILPDHPTWNIFPDWEMYRSSAAMLKEGIALLDRYYYDWMNHQYSLYREASAQEIATLLKIVECIAGDMGWRPVMEPFIDEGVWHALLHRFQAKLEDKAQELIDRQEREWARRNYKGVMSPEDLKWQLEKEGVFDRIPIDQFPSVFLPRDLPQIRKFLLEEIGISAAEIDRLIQWRVRPLSKMEQDLLVNVVTVARHAFMEPANKEKLLVEGTNDYVAYMTALGMSQLIGENYFLLPEETKQAYDHQKTMAIERAILQRGRLVSFVSLGCAYCGYLLEREPVFVPSSVYQPVEISRRTYADVRDELVTRLVSLPKYEAIAALVDKSQVVHLRTTPLSAIPESARQKVEEIRERSHRTYNKPMQEIMESLRRSTLPPGDLPPAKERI